MLLQSNELMEALRPCLESLPAEVVAVYLYGSRARGSARATSDVDLAVLCSTPPPRTLDNPARLLEDLVEPVAKASAEAVILNDAAPDLIHRVLRDGLIGLDRDRNARIRFEVQARNQYFDLEPIRRLYRKGARVTDPALVAKNLAVIETCVAQLRTHARPGSIQSDIREQRFIEHTLQIAIQAILDVASHIVSDDRLGEPETNRRLFDILERTGRLEPALASTLKKMAGLRNILVLGYQDVDLDVLADVVAHRLDDFLTFVSAVRGR